MEHAGVTVTAVVCCGWPARAANVAKIVQDLQAATVTPDTIIVLDNFSDGSAFADLEDQVRVVAGHNWECRGKYVVGLLQFADFYLLNDDDMTVGARTLEQLLATGRPGTNYVTANRAVSLTASRKLSEGHVFDAQDVTQETPADVIYGSSAFMTHQALLTMFDAESRLRHKWPVEGDDILAGLANDVLIQPMRGDAAFRWLPDGGVAMASRPDYWTMRDDFTFDALDALAK